MKPSVRNISTQGDLSGRKITMTIDNNSMSQIMGFMADLYSDPAAAVIREYTTNAIDSHIRAGQARPVELSTPSALSPVFVVEDFGVGLSEDDIEHIYSQFGNSTKRDSNLEAGTFGLGSKSGMTYTDQFTLQARKDGREILVLIARDIDGTGSMNIISNTETDKPNGVRIEIPVNTDHSVFRNKAYEFAKYVAPGLILVDGKEPERDYIKIDDRLAILISDNYLSRKEDKLVMGHVAYPIGHSYAYSTHNFAAVYFAEVGDVDIPPSREQLMYTPKTEKFLEEQGNDLIVRVYNWFVEQVAQAKDKREAFLTATRFWNATATRNATFLYEDEEIPKSIKIKTGSIGPQFRASWTELNVRNRQDIEHKWTAITGFTNSRFTKTQAKKIAEFFEIKGQDTPTTFVLDKDLPFAEYLDYGSVYDWEDIKKATQKPRQPRPKNVTRPVASVKLWEGLSGEDGEQKEGYFEPNAKTVYYASKSWINNKGGDLVRTVIEDGTQFFYVARSEQQRFLKQTPHAEHIKVGLRKFVQEYLENLTVDDLMFYKHNHSYMGRRLDLDPEMIDDPDLKAVILHNAPSQQSWRYNRARHAWRVIGSPSDLVFPKFLQSQDTTLKDRYPILASTAFVTWDYNDISKARQHMYDYANRIYSDLREKHAV